MDDRVTNVYASRLRRDVEQKGSIDTVTLKDTIYTVPGTALERLIWDARANEPAIDWQSRPISQSRIAKCLRKVRRITENAETPLLRFEVASSIDILCESLDSVVQKLFLEKVDLDVSTTPYKHDLLDHMKERNWCPARVRPLPAGNLLLKYIASLLPSVSHRDCEDTFCSRRPQNVDDMQAKHNFEHCDGTCPVKAFNQDDLITILHKGGIPGISETRDDHGQIHYEIVDTTGREYIAMSHVWSHGLGNPSKNALLLCQIRLLFKRIRAIASPDLVLWIDTILCLSSQSGRV